MNSENLDAIVTEPCSTTETATPPPHPPPPSVANLSGPPTAAASTSSDSETGQKPGSLKGRWGNVVDKSKQEEEIKRKAVRRSTLTQFGVQPGASGKVKDSAQMFAKAIEAVTPKQSTDATVVAARALAKAQILRHIQQTEVVAARGKVMTQEDIDRSSIIVKGPMKSVEEITGVAPREHAVKPRTDDGTKAAVEPVGMARLKPVSASQRPYSSPQSGAGADIMAGEEAECKSFLCGQTHLYHASLLSAPRAAALTALREQYEVAGLALPCELIQLQPGPGPCKAVGNAVVLVVEDDTFLAVTLTQFAATAGVRERAQVVLRLPSQEPLLELQVDLVGGNVANSANSSITDAGVDVAAAEAPSPPEAQSGSVAAAEAPSPPEAQSGSVATAPADISVPVRVAAPAAVVAAATDSDDEDVPEPALPAPAVIPETTPAVFASDAEAAPEVHHEQQQQWSLPAAGADISVDTEAVPSDGSSLSPLNSPMSEDEDYFSRRTAVEMTVNLMAAKPTAALAISEHGGVSSSITWEHVQQITCSSHGLVLQLNNYVDKKGVNIPSCVIVTSDATDSSPAGVSLHQSIVEYSYCNMTVVDNLLVDYTRCASMSGWMKKWPMNGAMGQATRRYFMLHNDELAYHKRPPPNYESSIATPYVLRYEDQRQSERTSAVQSLDSVDIGSPGGPGARDEDNLLKTVHITPHTRVTAEKARVGLLYSCMNISALEGSLKCLADTEEENDTWMWNIYESMKFEACKKALLTSGFFADGSVDGKAEASRNPSMAAYQAQRKVTLISNRYFHQSYKHFRCVSVDIARHVTMAAKSAFHVALFCFHHGGAQSTRDFVTSEGAVGMSKGLIYSAELTDSVGGKRVFQLIPQRSLTAGLLDRRTLAGSEHLPSALAVVKLVNEHMFLVGGTNGYVRVCVRPGALDPGAAHGVIAGGADGVIECSPDGAGVSGGHGVDATVRIIGTSESCNPYGAAIPANMTSERVNRGLYYCSADDKGGLCLWQLQQEVIPGSEPGAVLLRAKGVLCGSLNIGDLRRRGRPAQPSITSVRDQITESATSVLFVSSDNYLLVTTSAGRVLLFGIGRTQSASVTDTLLAGVARSSISRLSVSSGAPSVALNSWTEVELMASSRGSGHGTTPPASLSAVSNTGTNRPVRCWVALEHYTEDSQPRVRLILWKVTMNKSGNSAAATNNAVVCQRQVLPESVLLFAVSKLTPL